MSCTNPAPRAAPATQAASQQQQGRQAAELDWIWSFCCSHSDNQSPREGVHLPISVLQNSHTAVLRAELPFITSYNFSWLPAGFCWNLKIRLKLPMWALLLHVVLFPDLSLNISWALHCLTRLALQIYPLFPCKELWKKKYQTARINRKYKGQTDQNPPTLSPCVVDEKEGRAGERKVF